MSLSPGYAPPEIVHAFRAGQRSVHTDASTDMWALGVIAFEMLTKQRLFGKLASADDMMARTIGTAPLPWEDSAPEAQAKLRDLRGLKRAVLQCLDRNPAARPSSVQLLQSWNHMFDDPRTGFSAPSNSSTPA
jgi:serine/threonine protein kinase